MINLNKVLRQLVLNPFPSIRILIIVPLFEIISDDKDYPNSYKTLIGAKDETSAKKGFNLKFPNREISSLNKSKGSGIIYDSIIVHHEE